MSGTRPTPQVLDDVAGAVGTDVAVVEHLAGGLNAGAYRVRLDGRSDAVLKAEPRTRPEQLEELSRARRVVDRMRPLGYPTPAWLAAGAVETHVWHLTEHVDGTPVPDLTPSLVDQLVAVVELQAGQASEPHDHGRYAWRVATRREAAAVRLSAEGGAVSALAARCWEACRDLAPPPEARDMVHADLNPSNVLVRDGLVVAVVNIGNAGCGTRATDLTTLLWHTFRDPLDGVRERLWARIVELAGPRWTTALLATQVLLQLEWPVRLGRHELVPAVVERGHRALDELDALR